MPHTSVEELSLSLVREFLSRKGLKVTLTSMDQELPRSEESISNRLTLAKAVGIERLMKMNKEEATPYRSMIEVIVKMLLSSSAFNFLHNELASRQSKAKDSSTSDSLSISDSSASTISKTATSHADAKTVSSHADTDSLKTFSTSHGKPITSSPRQPTEHFDILTSSQLLGHGERSEVLTDSKNVLSPSKESENTSAKNEQKSNLKGFSGPSGVFPSSMGSSHTQSNRGRQTNTERFMSRKPEIGLSGSGLKRSTQSDTARPPLPTDLNQQVCEVRDDPVDLVPTLENQRDTSIRSELKLQGSKVTVPGQLELSQHPMVKELLDKRSKIGHTSTDTLLCEDLEDFEFDTDHVSLYNHPDNRVKLFPRGQPISLEMAKDLRQLLFGTSKGPSFNSEWRGQNFVFCDLPGLEFGLVQHKGGPCGLLACVQAFVLKHLMFAGSSKSLDGSPKPSPVEREASLVLALGDILWKAGGSKRATVALVSSAGTSVSQTTPTYQPDHITERLVCYQFRDRALMREFLTTNLSQLQHQGSAGCIQFLFSVILTKGSEGVRSDMDEANGRLIGAHGYCTQEMVNLMLTGVASSNVFDREMYLDYSSRDKVLLRGIPEQSEVGLLSLFEHFGSCTVGSHYKDPHYPIWLVYSESHFTVLFSHQETLLKERRLEKLFNLYYYDGLAKQDEVIRLTIDNTAKVSSAGFQDTDSSLTSPLEYCIHTKWKSATVDWNGTDPIL